MSTPVNTIAAAKIWKPIAVVGTLGALTALFFAGKEMLAARKTNLKKQQVKKGLAEVQAELTETVSEQVSNCTGCMSSAAGPTLVSDVNIIKPTSIVPPVYS